MIENWRFNAKSITKYNPIFRDESGNYFKEDWVGFFQIGKEFNSQKLNFDNYLEVEEKYIKAAYAFLKFHSCNEVYIKNVEKYTFSDYDYFDFQILSTLYNSISENDLISIDNLSNVFKLIFRGFIWCEIFCGKSESIAIRFGYDFYMYFNSNRDMTILLTEIEELGLYVY